MSDIYLSNVSKKIKKNIVLHNVNLCLDKGKIYGFVGHNGSGKSMLFRVISGLVKPTTGEVKIFGDVLHKDVSFPRDISVLLEKPGFLEQYSGFRNLKILASIKNKINDDKIKDTLKKVGLEPNDTRPVKSYSLGMKQKLAIAQAIMEEPQLILLDEPMNGLDEDSVINIRKVILNEKNRGATILLTSHHKIDIETLCDDVFSINSGHISTINKREDILSQSR